MQPFQAFLTDTRTRPLGLRYLGYLISLGVHAPPVTVFAMTWLTQTLLLGGGMYDLPQSKNDAVYYVVPIALDAHFPGLHGPGGGGGSPTSGGAGKERRGAAAHVRHRARRPLMLPAHRRTSTSVLAEKPAVIGPEEHVEEDGGLNGLGGHGVGGLAGNGTGIGHGSPGGEGDGPGGDGVLAAREPRTKRARPRVLEEKGSEDSLEEAFGPDDETLVGKALTDKPSRVSMEYAAYLRTYESFPSLPEACWPPGRTTNAVLVEICVTERGTVNDVVVRQSAGADTDDFLTKAIRSWRYRPRLVAGSPRPFCHPIRIVYKKELRFDRSW
jgi:hypothetical protein